jgi:hypothetical protein
VTPTALLALLLAAAPGAAPDPLAPPPGAAPPPEVAPPAPAAPPVAIPGSAARGTSRTPDLAAPPPRPKYAALRVAVLDPRATGEVPPRPLTAFAQSLVPEIRKLEGVSAIGMAEIRDMLGFERQRQMLGCAADDACMAEIAGSLGVDEIVSAELVLVGKSYTLSMRRLDMRKAKVVQSDSRSFERRDGEELLSVAGPAIGALFPDRQLREGKTRGIDRDVIRRLNPPPLPRWVTITTAAAALGCAAVGTNYAVLASNSTGRYRTLVDRSRTEAVSAADLNAASSDVRSMESTRNAFLYAAGALAVAAGVETFFTDWRNDRAALVPVATPAGGGVAVTGRF